MPAFHISLPLRRLSMSESTHITCHRCGHAWDYFGAKTQPAYLATCGGKPVRIWCPRCRAAIRIDRLVEAREKKE